jgi:hypothetical protein
VAREICIMTHTEPEDPVVNAEGVEIVHRDVLLPSNKLAGLTLEAVMV